MQSNNTLLLLLSLLVILAVAAATYYFGVRNFGVIPKTEKDRAYQLARVIFDNKKKAGIDMASGPCLSNNLLPDWVADIVHRPRVAADDLPSNQCTSFLEGKAHHFVELDLNGNLVRIY